MIGKIAVEEHVVVAAGMAYHPPIGVSADVQMRIDTGLSDVETQQEKSWILGLRRG